MCILLMAKLFLDGFLLVSPESVPSPTSNDIHQQTMSFMQENALHSNFTEKHYGNTWRHSYSIWDILCYDNTYILPVPTLCI